MDSTHRIDISDLSILLIEPSKTQSKIITQHLRSEDIGRIECVHSGKKALELLSQYKPDLIISSMYLPNMTAVTLVEQIKSDENLSDIPFMLISSETRFDALDPLRQAGVIAILPKPFSHDDIKRALNTSLEYLNPDEVTFDNYDIEDIRVLVVDDSSMARKHISRVLNNMGITQITLANDGKEGVDIFSASEESFDLIVTDFNMPIMDGQELVTYIRTQLKNTFIPILMVTSENNETRLNNVLQAGVSGICDKPFEPATVKEILRRTLNDL